MEQLQHVADAFLLHDRSIEVRLDDSIARILGGEPVLLRRARGYVPAPLPAPFEVDGIAALGGIMKSTVCIGRGQTAYVSQYLGTLENIETLDHMEFVLGHLAEVLGAEPSSYVMDLHPGGLQNYLLPKAQRDKTLRIQHHHAHAVACLAENRVDETTLCFVYDGLGLGDDGTVWGGEILMTDLCSSRRIGHLETMDLPGGDAATEYPGRIVYAALAGLVPKNELDEVLSWMPALERERVLSMKNPLQTSSMGRLFDALSALLDVCRRQTYEGQAGMELEAVADPDETGRYGMDPLQMGGKWILPGKALLAAAFHDLTAGVPKETIAARFHRTLAYWTACVPAQQGAAKVGLSGGCFQNALLFEWACAELSKIGIQPLVHRRLPPGDESVSYGQLITAAARRAALVNKEVPACA
jgi:hydrogenase maturation protein HypF